MKKFLSKIMFAAVAILSVAGFTSCNNVDDDPYVPEQTTVQDKLMYEAIPSYVAYLSDDVLNIYDVKLVLHSGDQSKEVELTKANGEKQDDVTYYYLFSEVNGQKGITSVEAKVTPKAEAKTLLENMPADKTALFIYGGRSFKATYDTNGNLMTDITKAPAPSNAFYSPSQMLVDMGGGELAYQYQAGTIEMHLAR